MLYVRYRFYKLLLINGLSLFLIFDSMTIASKIAPGKATQACAALLVLLCFCVGMQMLGMPVSMWNFVEEPGASENLDFSILPIVPRLSQSILLAPVELIQENLRTIILSQSAFHPPNFLR